MNTFFSVSRHSYMHAFSNNANFFFETSFVRRFFITLHSISRIYLKLQFLVFISQPPLFISKTNWNVEKKCIHVMLPNGNRTKRKKNTQNSFHNCSRCVCDKWKWGLLWMDLSTKCALFSAAGCFFLNIAYCSFPFSLSLSLSAFDYIFGTSFNLVNMVEKNDTSST